MSTLHAPILKGSSYFLKRTGRGLGGGLLSALTSRSYICRADEPLACSPLPGSEDPLCWPVSAAAQAAGARIQLGCLGQPLIPPQVLKHGSTSVFKNCDMGVSSCGLFRLLLSWGTAGLMAFCLRQVFPGTAHMTLVLTVGTPVLRALLSHRSDLGSLPSSQRPPLLFCSLALHPWKAVLSLPQAGLNLQGSGRLQWHCQSPWALSRHLYCCPLLPVSCHVFCSS